MIFVVLRLLVEQIIPIFGQGSKSNGLSLPFEKREISMD